MKLYYTPRSHYSRKVRILVDSLALNCDLIDVGNVADLSKDLFGPNPLMKVPTLIDGDCVVFDSDNIAQYLVRQYDSNDRFQVLTSDISVLNARVVMNGIMAADVEIVLAARAGIDAQQPLQLQKMYRTIENGLNWLENNSRIFSTQLSYIDFHLACMWDHLVFYNVVPLKYEALRECVKRVSGLPYVKSTAPI